MGKQKKAHAEANAPGWRKVGRLRCRLSAKVPGDWFAAALLKGVIRTGRDRGNPIRGNMVASALRELVGHVLHGLAPDAQVRKCVWFVQATDTPTVTRRQRAIYIVQAGLADDFVRDRLRVDTAERAKPLLASFDALSKHTHVRPETVVGRGRDVRRMIADVLTDLTALLDAAARARDGVERTVASAMHGAVFQNMVSESIQELDELSIHTTIDDHQIDLVQVLRMDARGILFRVTGVVEVELQYGSNSDVGNDIGYRTDDNYPYLAVARCEVRDPLSVTADDIELQVDTRSFSE